MKYQPAVRMGVIVGLGILAVWAIRYLDRIPPQRLASLMGITVTVSDIGGPTPSVSVLPVSDQVPALTLGAVAVQTYRGSTLIRSASGTAVTSDGLIVTVSAGAPYGSGSFFYQVTTAKGAVAQARRVAYDAGTGLVLLRAEGLDTDPVTMDGSAEVRAGDQLAVLGATIALSRYTPVVLPAAVVTAPTRAQARLSVDKDQLPLLTGARVVDRRGRTVGILKPGPVTGITDATAVEGFVRRYLASQSPRQ